MSSPIGRIARIIHIISAYWVLLLAVLVFLDVTGRSLLNTPLEGTAEIIKNSVVAITFLQLPLAIYRGGMIRTTVIMGLVGPRTRRLLRSFAALLGLAFFAAAAFGSFEPFVEAVAIREYEGEGALRVPTYPTRLIVLLMSIFSAAVYLYLLVLDWTGHLETEDGDIVGH